MAYRKERALLVMGANGAGLAVVGPKVIDARIAENWDLLNLYSALGVTFVPGMIAGYIALSMAQAEPKAGTWLDRFRLWEVLAIFPLLTIAFYLEVGTNYREPAKSAEVLAPGAASAAKVPEK